MSKRQRILRQKRRNLMFGMFSVVVIASMIAGYLAIYRSVARYPEDRIADHIYIGSVSVAGLTKEEAVARMKDQCRKDRTVSVNLLVSGKSENTTLANYGVTYEKLEETVQKAFDYGKEGSLWERFRMMKRLRKKKLVLESSITLDRTLAEKLLEERAVPLADHAKDAEISFQGGHFSVAQEQEGVTVNTKETISELEKLLNKNWNHQDISMEAVLQQEEPKIRAAELETIQDKLGSFETDAGGGARWKNLKAGVSKLNGTLVMPGEEVSVHDVTAPYDEENGYVAAGSYENGQVVDTFGGGICQVSSTLYNAVLYAELKVVKRYPHSMLVSYVSPSRDAAIAGDTKDFVFANNYETPIYIFGEIDSSNVLRFVIYGKETREEGRKVEYESEVLSTEEPGVKYKTNSSLPLGEMKSSGSPHAGKEAVLWKIVKKNGKEVSREEFNNSTYLKADKMVEVGTKSSNSGAASIVADAVSSQDRAKINAAISQARAMGSE